MRSMTSLRIFVATRRRLVGRRCDEAGLAIVALLLSLFPLGKNRTMLLFSSTAAVLLEEELVASAFRLASRLSRCWASTRRYNSVPCAAGAELLLPLVALCSVSEVDTDWDEAGNSPSRVILVPSFEFRRPPLRYASMGRPVRRPVTIPVRGCGTSVCFFRIAVRGDTGCGTITDDALLVLLLPVAATADEKDPLVFCRQGSHVVSVLKFRQPQVGHRMLAPFAAMGDACCLLVELVGFWFWWW